MNTLNPAGNAALDRDAQALLDAVYHEANVFGPNTDRIVELIQRDDAQDLDGSTVDQIKELLGVPDVSSMMAKVLDLLRAAHEREHAAKDYVKTRRLVEAVSATPNPYL